MPPLLAPLLALAAGHAVLGAEAPVGLLVAVVAGALAPDLELLMLFVLPALAVRWHQRLTHSASGLVGAALVAAALVWAAGGPSFLPSLAASLAGAAVHAACDAISTGGLPLRRGRRIGTALIIPFDPWTTGLAALGSLCAISFPAVARLSGLATVAAVFYLVGVRAWLRGRALVLSRSGLGTPTSCCYPRPESPMRWTVVSASAEGASAFIVDVGKHRAQKLDDLAQPDDGVTARSALARAVVDRAEHPVVRRRGNVIELRDLRFAYDWPWAAFGADLELDDDGRLVRERAYL